MKSNQLHRAQYRLPLPLVVWLKGRAEKNFRSMNAEIVEILRCAHLRDATSRKPETILEGFMDTRGEM